jgi:hypothetical protein
MSQAVIVAASTLFGVIIAQAITSLRDNTAYKRQEAKDAKEHQRRLNEETANRLRTLYASLLYDIQMWWGLISNMHDAITKLENLILQQPPSGPDLQQFVLDRCSVPSLSCDTSTLPIALPYAIPFQWLH